MARTWSLGLAFFASGAAALTFETLWWEQAGLAFGNSIWASSLVLSAFMLGLALGNRLAARSGERLGDPLRAFALLELAVACSGVALVFVLPLCGSWLAPIVGSSFEHPHRIAALRFGLAFVLLLTPALAMGMSLPLLVRALAARQGFARALSRLYFANTLGAVCGTLLTEMQWLAAFGVYGTALCAAALDVGAVVLAWWVARGPIAASTPEAALAPAAVAQLAPAVTRSARMRCLCATALAGTLMLALEVVWLRILLLFLNDTPLAFAWTLATVLTGIAFGSLLGGRLSRTSQAESHGPFVAVTAGVVGAFAYLCYPWVFKHGFSVDQGVGTVFSLSAALMLPTAFLSGALFVVTGTALRAGMASDHAAAGELGFANTLGAALGPLLAAFVLLPRLGMTLSLLVLFALYALVSLLLPVHRPLRIARYHGLEGLLLALGAFSYAAAGPLDARASASRWMRPGDTLVRVREGTSATYMQIAHRLHGRPLFQQIATNAYSMSVDDYAARRYMQLFALLPHALHPRVVRALCIGYGIGNTAEALLANRELQQLDVADVSPEMLELARAVGQSHGRVALDDPRVRLVIEDGRYLLAAGGPGYDLITGEPPPPIIAGVNALYSRDYFELVRARLRPGGIATYWLPLINITAESAKALIGAFCGAFDDCTLWHASARNLMLMGTRDARGPADAALFTRAFDDAVTRGELASIGFEHPAQLGALFIGDAAYLRSLTSDVAPLRDAWPKRLQEARGADAYGARDALLWEFRDTKAARARFAASAFVAHVWPPELLRASLRQFENQRLINDLMFPGPTPARQIGVLHQVLHGTPAKFPVLLLLGSDPDAQRALASAGAAALERNEWLPHRLAGLLAERDFAAARALAVAHPEMRFALPGLREYVMEAGEGER